MGNFQNTYEKKEEQAENSKYSEMIKEMERQQEAEIQVINDSWKKKDSYKDKLLTSEKLKNKYKLNFDQRKPIEPFDAVRLETEKPTGITKDAKGRIRGIYYQNEDGQFHRLDGPALVAFHESDDQSILHISSEEYFEKGKHKEKDEGQENFYSQYRYSGQLAEEQNFYGMKIEFFPGGGPEYIEEYGSYENIGKRDHLIRFTRFHENGKVRESHSRRACVSTYNENEQLESQEILGLV